MPNIVHFEIPADDIQRAKNFYAGLFGWKIESMQSMDYMIIDPYSVPGGGMMKRTQPEQQIMVNIGVPSVDEYAAKVEKLGGKIIVPKEAVPGMGYFVICKDTENNTFGIWEPNPTARDLTEGKEPIATIGDIIGTWYLSGDRTKPCQISLEADGMHLTISLGDTNYPGYSFNGIEIYRGGYPTGILSNDLKRIDWTFVEAFWER
jgi:predicted enzyme related to lactoylglutathione lyase